MWKKIMSGSYILDQLQSIYSAITLYSCHLFPMITFELFFCGKVLITYTSLIIEYFKRIIHLTNQISIV